MPSLPLTRDQMIECGYTVAPTGVDCLFSPSCTIAPCSRLVCLRENTVLQFFPADMDSWYICAYLFKCRLINGTVYPAGANGVPATIRNMYREGLLPRDPGLLINEGSGDDVYPVLFGDWYSKVVPRTWSSNPYRKAMSQWGEAFFAPGGVESPDEIGVPGLLQFVRDDGEEPSVAGARVEAPMQQAQQQQAQAFPSYGNKYVSYVSDNTKAQFPSWEQALQGKEFQMQLDGRPFQFYGTMAAGSAPRYPVVSREVPRPRPPAPDVTEIPKRKIRLFDES